MGREKAMTSGMKDADDKTIRELGEKIVEAKYGNLFQMYEKIVDENPYETPMMIYPAVHYTMGGIWVDYNLMTTIPGLYAIGEANFSDHGANRLGASALMQGLSDGYFVAPYTVANYIGSNASELGSMDTGHEEFTKASRAATERLDELIAKDGKRTVDDFHRELGHIMWDKCVMA